MVMLSPSLFSFASIFFENHEVKSLIEFQESEEDTDGNEEESDLLKKISPPVFPAISWSLLATFSHILVYYPEGFLQNHTLRIHVPPPEYLLY